MQSIVDFAQKNPLQFIGVLAGMLLVLAFLIVATFRRVHPVIVWLVLFPAMFAVSQISPENRDQKLSIGIAGALICAGLVWWWFGRIAPKLREQFRRKD